MKRFRFKALLSLMSIFCIIGIWSALMLPLDTSIAAGQDTGVADQNSPQATDNQTTNEETANDQTTNDQTNNNQTATDQTVNNQTANSQGPSGSTAQAAPAFEFPSWTLEQVDKYIETLKEQSAPLSAQDIARSKQRVLEAKQKNLWPIVAAEYTSIVGKDPKNRDAWIELSLAKQHQRMTEDNWQLTDQARYAALVAYRLSKSNEEKAASLLVYGNTLDPDSMYETPNYQQIYAAIKSLVNLPQFRKAHKEFAGLMPFRYSKMEVNNQIVPPNVCFYFTQALSSQTFNRNADNKSENKSDNKADNKNALPILYYQDYINITPSGNYSIKVTGRQLCVSPLQFGQNYSVIIKSGLPNELGEKTELDYNLSLKVKDQNSRLGFSPKSYVLLREEETKLPLSSVNVDTVRIKIFRITDHGLNEIGNNDYSGFLKQVWEYNLDDIQNKYGELVYQGEMDMGGERNKTTVKQIPFSTVIQGPKPGVYLVYAEEKNALFGDKATASQWLIISDLGLTTFTESEGGIAVNVRSIKTGEALSDVELQLVARNNSILGKVKTDKNGMGYFEASIARGKDGMSPLWVLAYGKKDDFSLLDLDMPAFDFSDRAVQGRKAPGPLDAFLYTEQGVYRPLETVHLNALLRDDKANAKGGLPLTFRVLRPDEVVVQSVTLTGSDLGFYELSIPLSGASRTGQWTVLAFADVKKNPIGRATFSVEDFVPSRILVQLKSDKPFLALNKTTDIEVTAKYLFGAKAAGLSGTAVMTQKVNHTPYPKYSDFAFGIENEIFRDTRTNLPFSSLDNDGRGKNSS